MPRRHTTLADDLAAARTLVPVVAARSARVIEAIGDPKAASPLPGWSVADVAVHLGVAVDAYATAVTEGLDPKRWGRFVPEHPDLQQRVAVLNASTLSLAGSDAHRAVPGQIRDSGAAIVEALEGRDPDEPCPIPWFGADKPLSLAAVVGLFFSETMLHTLDVARATGQDWTIPPAVARLIISLAYLDTIPQTVDTARAATVKATVRFHVRGGVTFGMDIDGPRVETYRDPGPGRRVDCHISVDPVAFLLVASGRTSQVRAIATGGMIAYGRKPWLGPKIAALFVHP